MIKPLNILLIDDSVKTQDMFGFALNDLQINYACRFAQNVDQAINSLRLKPADFIFVDVNMPALNSFRTLKRIIKARFINDATVVIYTDHNESEICKRAMKLGVMLALKKKNEIFELIADLKNILLQNNNPVSRPFSF